MKLPHTLSQDIQNALRLIDKALPETDQEIEAFIGAVESGAIELPELPEHLKPAAIAAAIRDGRTPAPAGDSVILFPSAKAESGLSGLKMAARNGDGPLSNETLRKMEENQED